MALGLEAGLGAIGGLFGKPKLKQIKYSDAVDAELGNQTTNLNAATAANNATLANYEAALARLRPMVQDNAAADLGLLGQLNTRELNYNPVSDRERIREGDFKAWNDLVGRTTLGASKADKLAMAARGYGGGGRGAYEQILRDRTIGGLALSGGNTILGNLANNITATDLARQRTNAGILANVGARRAIPTSVLDFEGMPIGVRNAATMAGIAGLGGLADVARTNSAGFKEEKNSVANFLEGMGRAGDELGGTALSLYSGGLLGGGGGGGGGMLGGLFGGGGGGASRSAGIGPYQFSYPGAAPAAPSYPSTVGWGAPAPSYYQFPTPSYADPRLFFGGN